MSPSCLTFVSVVFDAEIELLRLQAQSFSRFAPIEIIDEIIVIDNTVRGLRGRPRSQLISSYGPHAGKVSLLRAADLEVDRSADGWRSQQAAKLLVSRRIQSPHYVVLDAKNHFIRDITILDFLNGVGVPHGGRHSYEGHPLIRDLVTTLSALGMDDSQINSARASFPVTATPFVFITEAVRASLDHLEWRTGVPFADAFERKRMLEFFYYSGWMALNRPEVPISDGTPIEAPVVWGSDAGIEGVRRATQLVAQHDAPVLGVHRRAVMRADRRASAELVRFWASRGLLSQRDGEALIRRFRFSYRPAMIFTRLAERSRRVRR